MTLPIPTGLPVTPPRRDPWAHLPTFAECGHTHPGPDHARPERPQCAGHERERDDDE